MHSIDRLFRKKKEPAKIIEYQFGDIQLPAIERTRLDSGTSYQVLGIRQGNGKNPKDNIPFSVWINVDDGNKPTHGIVTYNRLSIQRSSSSSDQGPLLMQDPDSFETALVCTDRDTIAINKRRYKIPLGYRLPADISIYLSSEIRRVLGDPLPEQIR
jgi:hypothetical protein